MRSRPHSMTKHIWLRWRPFATKLAVQMIEPRRRKSDYHSVDLPTVALAAVVVVLVVVVCVFRLSH